MKEKVEKLLNKPNLTMIEVQHLYQELASKQGKISFVDFVRKFINECETDDEKIMALNDIEQILDDIRSEIYDQQEERTEAL